MEQSDEEKLAEIHRLTRYKNEELAKEIDDKLLCVVESRRTVPKYIAEMESRIAKLKLDRLVCVDKYDIRLTLSIF